MIRLLVYSRRMALTLLVLFTVAGCQQNQIPDTAEAPATTEATPVVETTSSPAEEEALLVPQASAPVINGRIEPGEWDGAAVEKFADGSELLLMGSDNSLCLAIRSVTPEMIVGNVFLNQGDEIQILHVSAALGTAIYKQGEGTWQQVKDFAWCCRQVTESEAAAAERAAFLADEQWAAVNSRVGQPNELEYQIEVAPGTTRLAVSILRSSAPEVKTPWPAELDDDTVKPTPGGLPVELDFRPDEWVTIVVE